MILEHKKFITFYYKYSMLLGNIYPLKNLTGLSLRTFWKTEKFPKLKKAIWIFDFMTVKH